MGLRMATILFADIVGCAEVSNELSPQKYDEFVSEFHRIGMDVQALLFPQGEYTVEEFELAVRGDEVCLILHTTPEVSGDTWVQDKAAQRKRREEVEKAVLFAVCLKMLWLVSDYNKQRVANHLLPRDIGVGIHHGPVIFAPHPATGRKKSSEGFAINLAKRIEGVSRLGQWSKIFISKEVRSLLGESNLELEFDDGRRYDLKGITTAPHLHEVIEIGNSRAVFEKAPEVMKKVADASSGVIEGYYAAASVHDEDFWLRKLVGYVMLAQKDERALELLRKELPEKEDMGRDHFEQGNALFELGEYAEAIEQYKQFLDAYPRVASAWNNMGGAYYKKGDYDEAIRCYKEAIDIKPDMHEAWCNMGNAYYEESDYDQAIQCHKKAIEIEPDDHVAWYNMGCAYALKEEAEDAARCLSKAIQLNAEYRPKARSNKNFDKVRDHPAIKALLEEGA